MAWQGDGAMVGEVCAAGRTGGTDRAVWFITLCWALLAGLGCAAAFSGATGRSASAAAAPAAPQWPDPPPATEESNTATPTPHVTPSRQSSRPPSPSGRASARSPSRRRTTSTTPTSRSGKRRTDPPPTGRPPARHGDDAPLAGQPTPSPTVQTREPREHTSGPAGSGPVAQLPAGSVHMGPTGYLSGVLIYTGIGALSVALGGLLLLAVQRRRW
jgi:hypothetical protein